MVKARGKKNVPDRFCVLFSHSELSEPMLFCRVSGAMFSVAESSVVVPETKVSG